MNILFISYDSYKYDGRLRELIKVAQELVKLPLSLAMRVKNQ